MSQNVAVNYFQWVEKNSKLNEYFIRIYNEGKNKEYLIEAGVQNPENELQNVLLFLPERISIEKIENRVAKLHKNILLKKNILFT